MISGCQIKNLGQGKSSDWATKEFRVRGSLNENGPWETLLEDELVDKSWGKPASLLNFTFKEPMEVLFLKFDLISYWGKNGGGLQYFTAILAAGGPAAITTTDPAITTTIAEVASCGGPVRPEVVQSTSYSSLYPASSVLILGEEDAWMHGSGKHNYWLAEHKKTTGQGFTIKLDSCSRLIAGCQIKNEGKGSSGLRGTRKFRVSGSLEENGPWETLVEDELVDTTRERI